MRRRAAVAALVLAIALIPGAAPSLLWAEQPGGDLVEARGTGTWTAQDGVAAAAQAHWVERWGSVIAYRVEAENATLATCLAPTLPHDASWYLKDHRSREESCRDATVNATAFTVRADNATGMFTRDNDRSAVYLEEPAAPKAPDQTLGIAVTAAAASLLLGATALGYLFVQERRLSRYLVRRLYEETKGRMPPDWPEHLRRQWIARVFIRGKN